MDYADKFKEIAKRIPQTIDLLETEEATKTALILPFINALGYNIFDPREVVPEFTADVGVKKGEKVDYAIKYDDKLIMLIEAKQAKDQLTDVHSSQLYRYFSVTHARIAVLTNGVQYQFFSDLDEPNKMDEKPFLEIDMLNLRDGYLGQLQGLTKSAFDLESMLSTANELKYMREIRKVLERQLEEPDEEFVRFFFSMANPNGRFVQSVREQFTNLVKKTLFQVISDRVNDRLHSALAKTTEPDPMPQDAQDDSPAGEDGIVTTEEEMEGFNVVKAIVREVISVDRVVHRDTKSYFGIICDNNNRKPICRLHFNRNQKYIGLFNAAKEETRHPIDSVSAIYQFAEQLKEITRRYVDGDPSRPGTDDPEE